MAQYSDQFLSLYGVNSIIGRSIVIHFANGSRLVCANIGYPTSVSGGGRGLLLYSPFRNSFRGDIFFRQHIQDNSTSSVYTNLERIDGGTDSNQHNWHVHDRPLDAAGTDCSIAGPHYNPRVVNISDPSYEVNCGNTNSTLQRNCEIGDLSNKGAPFDVLNGRIRQFYTDTDLPVLPDIDGYSIDGRSTVIHAENGGGPRIACTNLTQYQPLEAISVFNDDQGVSGSVRFYQLSPYDPTQVTVTLRGLQQRFNGYHVHEYPVGPPSLGFPDKCGEAFTGGHWNPTAISNPGRTSDQFEIGDLSGKFGGLSGLDEISADYTDPNVPLFGPFSVIGRSIVIHLDDRNGTRSVCSDIQRTRQILQIVTNFSSASFSGNVTFSQPADDPYAETTITVAIDVNQMLQPPPVVVSSSTPLEVTPSTTTMATSTMTTSTIVTTEFLEASSTVVTTNPITMTTSSVTMTSSTVSLLQPFTSSVVQELPTSVTSQLGRPEPTPVSSPSPSPSPLTSSTVDIGSGSDLLVPFSTEEITSMSLVLYSLLVQCLLVHMHVHKLHSAAKNNV
jgi:Cu/Zn superoxide dismutase